MSKLGVLLLACMNAGFVLAMIFEMVTGDGNLWLEARAVREPLPVASGLFMFWLFGGSAVALMRLYFALDNDQ